MINRLTSHVFTYGEVKFVKFAKVTALAEELFPILASGRRSGRAETGRPRSHLQLVFSRLDLSKAAGKAALFTFPNTNRFSSCQDWRMIISCCNAFTHDLLLSKMLTVSDKRKKGNPQSLSSPPRINQHASTLLPSSRTTQAYPEIPHPPHLSSPLWPSPSTFPNSA